MDEPESFDAEHIRAERVKVLNTLIDETENTISEHVYRAQYEGYTDDETVQNDSKTETFFSLTAYLNSDKWRGIPFYISAGKGLDEAKVEVQIVFADIHDGPFNVDSCDTHENIISLGISPEQVMSITLNAKAPGLGYQIEPRTLSLTCDKGENEITNSYEKVLLDCLTGDRTLFTKTEEVLSSWKYITSILENWDSVPLHIYSKGTLPKK